MSEQRRTIIPSPVEQGFPYAPFDGVDPDIYVPTRQASGEHPDLVRHVPIVGWLLA